MEINNDGSISNDSYNVEGFSEEEVRQFVPLIHKTINSCMNKADDMTEIKQSSCPLNNTKT